VVECLLAIYFAAAVVAAAVSGMWGSVPFLLLFEVGFAYTAATTLLQSARRARQAPPPPEIRAAA
jgi:hypothetical protein